ncbi:hypothetical protein O3P69_014301 [Scylla paramamosain]|uniref:Uncharacterized protein n=1 Tax=Scylla paramamosain TaxID=85552 RepID=A0AAW0TBI5_SCYPA
MNQLLGDKFQSFDSDLFMQLFYQRLPPAIQLGLFSVKDKLSPEEFASLADDFMATISPIPTSVAAITTKQDKPQLSHLRDFVSNLRWKLITSSNNSLPASKALCAVEEMRQHAFMAMAQVTEPDSVVYYTDGSADPDSGRTGAAAITRGAETELVAILLALEHAQHRRERTVVLHTDSRTGLQALQQPYPSDNVGLVTAILGSLQSLAAQGRRTELVAIHLALEYAQHRPERSVVFHIDPITVLQALEQPYSSDNVGLVTIVLGSLQSLAAQARLDEPIGLQIEHRRLREDSLTPIS